MRGILAVVACVSLSTGCAAVFKGGHQDVRIVSFPDGADVRVDGQFMGEAPTTASLDRDRPQNVRVSKQGFGEQQVQIRKKADTAWFFWDIATCVVPIMLCIPVLVDAISGAWYSFDDEYRVKLDPTQTAPAAPPPWTAPVPLVLPPPSDKPMGF